MMRDKIGPPFPSQSFFQDFGIQMIFLLWWFTLREIIAAWNFTFVYFFLYASFHSVGADLRYAGNNCVQRLNKGLMVPLKITTWQIKIFLRTS
jgi:hypothetical protein